jgi:NAD(P)H-flavin reductase
MQTGIPYEKSKGVYTPHNAKILSIRRETPDISTFRVAFVDREVIESFNFKPGNFIMVSAFGYGEAAFAISSPPYQRDSIEFSVRRLGKVTQALHEKSVGDKVGVRGPYGTNFYLRDPRGKNLVFVAGGSGMASLRPMILEVIHRREDYRDLTVVYGAQTPRDIPFTSDFRDWRRGKGVNVILTVDSGCEASQWKGRVGYVPTILEQLNLSAENTMSYICGPQIMTTLATQILSEWGFDDKDIVTTLENRMKCGIGKCGRCNIGDTYVCKHGPVFTYAEIKLMQMSDY